MKSITFDLEIKKAPFQEFCVLNGSYFWVWKSQDPDGFHTCQPQHLHNGGEDWKVPTFFSGPP